MSILETLDLDTLDTFNRLQVEERINEYNAAMSALGDVINASQVQFDNYRLTFPDDFNFEAFLTQNNPAYHEAIFKRNQARNKLNNILKDYFPGWDKNAL